MFLANLHDFRSHFLGIGWALSLLNQGLNRFLHVPMHIEELLRVSHTAKLFELAPDSKAAFKILKPETGA